MLVNSRFHTRKNFPENYPQFGRVPPKTFACSVLDPKKFKPYQLEGAPNYLLTRGDHMSGAGTRKYECIQNSLYVSV
jgi:hypothetical protein